MCAAPLAARDHSSPIHLAARLLRPLCPLCSQVGSSALAASCFTKALAYHIVAECGFHVRRLLGCFMFTLEGLANSVHYSAS